MVFSNLALATRSVVAICLTGLVTPLICAGLLLVVLAGSVDYFPKLPLEGWAEFFFIVWFFGVIISMPSALLIGLLCELPKTFWLASSKIGGWRVFASSAALSLAFGWVLAAVYVTFMAPDVQNLTGDEKAGILFCFLAFSVGGLASATVWLRLVVVPLRKSRLGTTSPLPA